MNLEKEFGKTGGPGTAGGAASSFFSTDSFRGLQFLFQTPFGTPVQFFTDSFYTPGQEWDVWTADAGAFPFRILSVQQGLVGPAACAWPGPGERSLKKKLGRGWQKESEKKTGRPPGRLQTPPVFFYRLPSFYFRLLWRGLPERSDPSSFFLQTPGPSFFTGSFSPVQGARAMLSTLSLGESLRGGW